MKLAIFVSFALMMALDSVQAMGMCPSFCTQQYMPVCAQSLSTGQQRTFYNACLMTVENCRSAGDYQFIGSEPCSDVDYNCLTECPPDVYQPVCGISQWDGDLQTFSSPCEMQVANCRNAEDYDLYSYGACPGDNCPTFCPQIYSPVCGRSVSTRQHKTFSNSCLMAVENCTEGCDYQPILNRPCPVEGVY